MKILVIAPNPFFVDRGFSVRVYDQIRALKEKGHDLMVTAYCSGRDPEGIRVRRIPRLPGYGAEDLGARLTRIYLDAALLATTLRSGLAFRPDVIHAHLHEGGLIGLVTGKVLRRPVLLDVQGSLAGELSDRGSVKNRIALSLIENIERFIISNADIIAVSSPSTRKLLQKRFSLPDEKIEAVVDGVDPLKFPVRDAAASGAARRESGIPENSKVVMCVGVLHRYYGTEMLLEAARYLVHERRRNDLFFVIAGFPDRERYAELARGMKVESQVLFPGRVEYGKLARFLSMADIAVAPKLGGTESSGKLFHYMAAGLPVVCFDTDLNHEILGHEGTYARFSDARDLGDKIAGLADDPETAARCGSALRRKVMKEYTLERTSEQLLALYARMLRWKK